MFYSCLSGVRFLFVLATFDIQLNKYQLRFYYRCFVDYIFGIFLKTLHCIGRYSHHCVTKTKKCSVFLQVESEFVPLYNTYGIGLTTWSPLASGVLTGKYSKGNIPAESRFSLDNYKVIMETFSLYCTRVMLLFLLNGFKILMPPALDGP
jgi:hypothetical protein